MSASRLPQPKVFNDPVHGHIEIHPLCVKIMDTPQFQRLRRLAQLGPCYYVFPGASHNRFEHSLGVSFLAGNFVEALRQNQPELCISDEEVLCLKVAGLVHDLGHGPFSHSFERFLARHHQEAGPSARDVPAHEHTSAAMLDHAIEDNDLWQYFEQFGLDKSHLHFIKELVFGGVEDAPPGWEWAGVAPDRHFLMQIVANKRNGIDVDKFDYFARDCRHLGIGFGFDVLRLMKFARALPVDEDGSACTRKEL